MPPARAEGMRVPSQQQTGEPRTGVRADTGYYRCDVAEVARAMGVDLRQGLPSGEAARRLQEHGPNQLAARREESRLAAFARQYRDVMQLVLLGAAVVNVLVTGDVATSVVLVGLTLFNAVIGLRQEAKAEQSVKALAQMLRSVARVRRD